MSEPYIGEIRIFAGNFAPLNWALCQGQLLAISEYSALYALLGTIYGGDGTTTFALPDLRSRVPVHQGSNNFGNYVMGQQAGEENITLAVNQLPAHTHGVRASSTYNGDNISPSNELWAASTDGNTPYTANAPNTTMNAGLVGNVGGNQPHSNIQPFVSINFIIALAGIFPSQN
jgi:microcystin-dependent protein